MLREECMEIKLNTIQDHLDYLEKIKAAIIDLTESLKKKKYNKEELINPVPNPRYDEVYEEGIKWLNEQ